MSEKEKEERKIIKIKKPLPPEPWRITKPEREPHREIKKAPPPEPTRKIKPKEEKKE